MPQPPAARPAPAASHSAIAGHGAARLPSVIVDGYNSMLRDEDGFVGDRARRAAFFEALDRWRAVLPDPDRDPFGADPSGEMSRKALDKLFGSASPLEDALLISAIEDYAAALSRVVRRFMRTREWRDTQRIAIGGGLRAARFAEVAIARAELHLRADGIDLELRPIRHAPDEAGLIGAAHLAPSWMFAGHDSILAVDIGGTNIRAGIVELNLHRREDLAKAAVRSFELWRHGDEEGLKREDAVERLVELLKTMVKRAEKQELKLAPFVGIGCPGEISPDGAIETGGQNLPGNWQSSRFSLPASLAEAMPTIAGEETAIVVHNDAVVQGLSEVPFMGDVEHWGVLTVGTGLGNARFTNREPPSKAKG